MLNLIKAFALLVILPSAAYSDLLADNKRQQIRRSFLRKLPVAR